MVRAEDPGLRLDLAAAASMLTLTFCAAPHDAVAQSLEASELARAKTLLELSRAELTAEQFTLLGGRLAQAEAAYVELTTVVRASQTAVGVMEGSGAAAAAGTEGGVVAGRALLGGVAELLPLLLMLWPATAHAPGVKQEPARIQAARAKLEEKLKELTEAARQVEAERQAAASRSSRPTLKRCLQAGEGGPEARAMFCRTLPDKTPEQRDRRRICWEAVEQAPQFWKNACYAILGN